MSTHERTDHSVTLLICLLQYVGNLAITLLLVLTQAQGLLTRTDMPAASLH